jgi:hypothetical protein
MVLSNCSFPLPLLLRSLHFCTLSGMLLPRYEHLCDNFQIPRFKLSGFFMSCHTVPLKGQPKCCLAPTFSRIGPVLSSTSCSLHKAVCSACHSHLQDANVLLPLAHFSHPIRCYHCGLNQCLCPAHSGLVYGLAASPC